MHLSTTIFNGFHRKQRALLLRHSTSTFLSKVTETRENSLPTVQKRDMSGKAGIIEKLFSLNNSERNVIIQQSGQQWEMWENNLWILYCYSNCLLLNCSSASEKEYIQWPYFCLICVSEVWLSKSEKSFSYLPKHSSQVELGTCCKIANNTCFKLAIGYRLVYEAGWLSAQWHFPVLIKHQGLVGQLVCQSWNSCRQPIKALGP